VIYGNAPNQQTCPVCLALPGALPVLNRSAVEFAVRAGLATHHEIQERSVFSRKNYFYPDLPKGYQITQDSLPICLRGHLDVDVPLGTTKAGKKKAQPDGFYRKRIGITRIHMEEDAGKSVHAESALGSDDSHMDLNRAGVPLLEIVSEPDMRSPAEAAAYLRMLHGILCYIGVTDGDMEKGQFRFDANLSLRPKGQQEFGTRTELKNMNSFRHVDMALQAEIKRQAKLLDAGESVIQATLQYDVDRDQINVMRLKENADEYRYFPEPDLLPLIVDPSLIEKVAEGMPELPSAKLARFESEYELSLHDARLLTSSRPLADFYEASVKLHGKAKAVANWILRDVLQVLKEKELSIEALALSPEQLVELIQLVESDRMTAKSAREKLFPALLVEGGKPEALMKKMGLEAVVDTDLIDGVIKEVVGENADSVEKFLGGDDKVLNFLMGKVMQKTQGKANPGSVKEALIRKIKG
jgi:aspartyl-tRNA(Asn)/glutamyl-tRNA(Gln) amidotransferase subunit B